MEEIRLKIERFGVKELKRERKSQGLTQKQVAEKMASYDYRMVADREKGYVKSDELFLKEYANALGVQLAIVKYD